MEYENIIIDDVEYPISRFSTTVKELVALRQKWQIELANERSRVLKTEAAIKQVDLNLATLVTQELAELQS